MMYSQSGACERLRNRMRLEEGIHSAEYVAPAEQQEW